jgi:hypothetical protein
MTILLLMVTYPDTTQAQSCLISVIHWKLSAFTADLIVSVSEENLF